MASPFLLLLIKGAKGNHYVSTSGNIGPTFLKINHTNKITQRNTITDRTKVWNILALHPPTNAPEELLEMYKDQISLLNIIVTEDEETRE